MPTLPKHLRPRWRYLGVGIETWPDADLDRGSVQRELWYTAQDLVGDVGSAHADLSLLGFTFEAPTGETVVRARHGHVEAARAVVACLDAVDGDPVGLTVRGVSGTVRACEERYCPRLAAGDSDEESYLGGPAERPQERTVAFGGTERPAVVRGNRADVRVDGGYTGATRFDLE
jgi:ribonuclease P/MRP protein subunit POP5